MMSILPSAIRKLSLAILGAAAFASAPVAAQMETIDPDTDLMDSGGIDGDLVEQPGDQPVYAIPETGDTVPAPAPTQDAARPSVADSFPVQTDETVAPDWADPAAPGEAASNAATDGTTYAEDDLIGAAEGVFGKGAEGVAKLIQDLLKDQGQPNAYIVGREAGGAFIVGARYGSGKLFHRIEGEKPVYWTGPSIGFDAGANAGNTFVLVYNLFDTEDLYKRFPAGEGQLYAVGGMHASYMRRGDVVLIPIRVGAGLRAGINAGYMKFSKKQRWLPF